MIRLFTALLACLFVAPVFGQSETTAILPPELPWNGKSLGLVLPADHAWATPFEKSGLERSPRYDETVAWLRRLVTAAPELEMISIGKSAQGRDIWMVIASREGGAEPARLAKSGRPTLLVQAGIHSGEIDGKDAGLMLLRDMSVRGTRWDWLDRVNLLFIPILSVDAHERSSRSGRINQRGPVEMGWRTNARNLNLNRDYAKLETEELRALVAVVERWRPDLYLDIHVTDGADYQYDITYGYNEAHAWSPNIARWLDEVLTPAANSALERMGHVPGKLTFVANDRDMTGGTVDWTAPPRFSSGWGDARHLPTVLVENHSLKPFRQRVLGTYVFLDAVIATLGSEYEALRLARARDETTVAEEVVLSWTASAADPPPSRMFLGVRSELYDSPITGTLNVRWTGEPIIEEVAVIKWNRPGHRVRRPAYYYIPAAWYPVADKLRLHGIEIERIEAPIDVDVEMYRLPDATVDVDNTPFEGRARYISGEPVIERREATLETGSYRVRTDQPLGTLAVLLLEPQAPDSFFQWGYFGSILQRTEYAEAYVMEPMARAMLDAEPALRAEFERKLLADAEFAGSATKRLQWFYDKTPFHDAEHGLYPVGRSVD